MPIKRDHFVINHESFDVSRSYLTAKVPRDFSKKSTESHIVLFWFRLTSRKLNKHMSRRVYRGFEKFIDLQRVNLAFGSNTTH